MPKALIIFSDGTGNKGGVTHDTNVWRLYQMIDRNKSRQLTFYDDGVGTQNFSPIKMISGALGWGLSRNIRQAYTFLVKNYEPGDKIYFFGFSRGAYTVRSLLEMIDACGLVKRTEKVRGETSKRERTSKEIDKLVSDAFNAYRSTNANACKPQIESNRPVAVEFVGVWDTVDAVGLPFNGSLILEFLFGLVGRRAYEFKDKVISGAKISRQALAIDDERKSFHPNYWQRAGTYTTEEDIVAEIPPKKTDLKQVWFAGMHSNCGGSYPKDGLAYITLDWMITEMENAEVISREESVDGWLNLRNDDIKQIRDLANDGDKLYDSREGMANFYRYAPRRLNRFATGTEQPIQVHVSVLNRIVKRAQNYAPLFVNQAPDQPIQTIPIAYTDNKNSQFYRKDSDEANRNFPALADTTKKKIESLVWWRAVVFYSFLVLSILIVVIGLNTEPTKDWTNPKPSELIAYEGTECYRNPLVAEREISITFGNSSCAQADVYADHKNDTGIWLERGRGYRFELNNIRNWEDAGIAASPFSGRESEGLVDLMRLTSYDSDARYMEVLGVVNGEIFRLGQLAQASETDQTESPSSGFPATYIAEASGELRVLVNEPVWSNYFFENNTGSAELTVRTVALSPSESERAREIIEDPPEQIRNWLAATSKTLFPAMFEHIIDNALSFPRIFTGWIALIVAMILGGAVFDRKIKAVARSGWDKAVTNFGRKPSSNQGNTS